MPLFGRCNIDPVFEDLAEKFMDLGKCVSAVYQDILFGFFLGVKNSEPKQADSFCLGKKNGFEIEITHHGKATFWFLQNPQNEPEAAKIFGWVIAQDMLNKGIQTLEFVPDSNEPPLTSDHIEGIIEAIDQLADEFVQLPAFLIGGEDIIAARLQTAPEYTAESCLAEEITQIDPNLTNAFQQHNETQNSNSIKKTNSIDKPMPEFIAKRKRQNHIPKPDFFPPEQNTHT